MNILVLGASGLVGRHLLARLSSEGHAVDALSRHPEQLQARPEMRPLRADLASEDWIAKAGLSLAQYDVIYHLAYASRLDETYNHMVTVSSVRTLMEGLHGITDTRRRHVVYVGSMAVFGSLPVGPVITEESERIGDTAYARNKIAAAKHAAMTKPGLISTILHPTGVYDESSPRIETYRRRLSLNYVALRDGGKGSNNIVHAADVALALTQCTRRTSQSPVEEYIINGETIGYGDWFERLSSTTTDRSWLKLPQAAQYVCRGPVRRMLNAVGVGCPLPIPKYKIAAYEHQITYSSRKAAGHFDFRPTTRFDDFCRRLSSSAGPAT